MYEFHLFVCENQKTAPKQGCKDRQTTDILQYMRQKIKAHNLPVSCRVNASGCLGKCSQGPVVVLYPQNKWFFEVDEAQVDEILSTFLLI